MITLLFLLLLAYLLGSIPFGLILTRAAGLGDIRNIGSGNIGATNVLRTGNKKLAALTLFLDGLKGAVAVLVATHFLSLNAVELVAIAALLGHLFPVWLKFKGGKGVATGIGVMVALNWPTGLLIMTVWLSIAFRFRISSLAALIAFGLAPIDVILFGRTDLVPVALIIAALVFWKHRENIRRLLTHTEPKIGENKNANPPA